jgi:hypothetical protein
VACRSRSVPPSRVTDEASSGRAESRSRTEAEALKTAAIAVLPFLPEAETRCRPCCMPAVFGMPNHVAWSASWLMKWPQPRSSWVTRQWPSPASSSWMRSMRVTPAGRSGLHRRGCRTPRGARNPVRGSRRLVAALKGGTASPFELRHRHAWSKRPSLARRDEPGGAAAACGLRGPPSGHPVSPVAVPQAAAWTVAR